MKECMNPPECCDVCKVKFKDRFFRGHWADLCLRCCVSYAEIYSEWIKQEDKFVKVEE